MESSGEVWLEIEILSHQHTGGFTARGLDGAPGERGRGPTPPRPRQPAAQEGGVNKTRRGESCGNHGGRCF